MLGYKGLGACLKSFNNKACHPVPTTVVYRRIYPVTGTNRVDLCLQGRSDSQTDQNITQILLFLDGHLMFHQAFVVNLTFNRLWYVCYWRALRVY